MAVIPLLFLKNGSIMTPSLTEVKKVMRRTSWKNCRKGLLFALALLCLVLMLAGRTTANLPPSVIRIEEDWSLVVNQPNSKSASPQISSQMARMPAAERFCNFHLNSVDLPSFTEGGMQLQVWSGSSNLAVVTSSSVAVMQTPNEHVTWTQYLRQDGGQLKFGISAASSQTWGDFRGMEVAIPGGFNGLDNYDVNYSVQNSGIMLGSNRVNSLTITAVRTYYSDGSMQTDSTQRKVY